MISIYVINLSWARQRYRRITQQLEELKLSYTIVDAVDGNFVSPYQKLRHKLNEQSPYKSRLLNAGEQGAALSHRKVYELMLRNNDAMALILEDDAALSPKLVTLLENLEQLPRRWNLCYLGYFYDTLGEPWFKRATYPINLWGRKELPFLPGTYMGKFILRPRGAFGYLLTGYAARQLLQESYNNPALIADRALSNCPIDGICGLGPKLIEHEDQELEHCIVARPPSNFEHRTLNRDLNRAAAWLGKKMPRRLPQLSGLGKQLRCFIRSLRASCLYLISRQYDSSRRDYEM